MKTMKEELLKANMKEYFSNSFGRVLLIKENKVGICEATERYIPIDKFMELFSHCSAMVKKHKVTHFIFDKRSLRTFHQPSMEWYFIEWKQDMLQLGLSHHYKILPDEPWFKKCVEAGRAQIMEDYPDNRLEALVIEYVDTVQEALDQIASARLSHD